MRILALDPGNSTGWFLYDTDTGEMSGGTIFENFTRVYMLITENDIDHVVYETFHLYPGAAKSLTWNEFYPCQVIGVIGLACERAGLQHTKQSPGVKKFSGGLSAQWTRYISQGEETSEHTKDAFLHMQYFLLQKKMCWPL